MPDETATQVIIVHLEYIKKAVDAIEQRLEVQNGRVRAAERSIGILNWAMVLIGAASLAAFTAIINRLWFQ